MLHGNKDYVSILTRPEGRVQSCNRGHRDDYNQFQSSPGPKAGCNYSLPRPRRVIRGFNPHPARRPGAIANPLSGERVRLVFQSSPGPKAGCNGALDDV